jgi:murein DD-endopeptidase MepM/ murein hydrolase activator NlpD
VYQPFGLAGHNGIDLRCQVGTPIFASMDGYVYPANDGATTGYGIYIKQRSEEKKLELTYGHMSVIKVRYGEFVHTGDLLGYSGNTGFSSGPHLHFGMRRLISSDSDISIWSIQDYNNGYKGAIDPIEYIITWKGTITNPTL